MTKYIIGKKIGMTRRFTDNKAVALTVVKAEPNTVIQIKKTDVDGYSAVQIGAGKKAEKKISKPLLGHYKKSGITPAIVKEFRTDSKDVKIGDKLDVSQFNTGDDISVSAASKGKGYAGVIKRHGFRRGPETHGSDHHRAPGSIGGAYPQRVIKGRKMPGHLGNSRVSQKGLKVVDVMPEDNIILLSGSIPGANKSWVEIKS